MKCRAAGRLNSDCHDAMKWPITAFKIAHIGIQGLFSRPKMKIRALIYCASQLCSLLAIAIVFAIRAAASEAPRELLAKPGLYKSLTEPPCSYCSTENRKAFIQPADRVLAWVRGAHNGGAISIRHFLASPRVINDTYGLFFYDPDGGYVSAFSKDNGYEFYGWRGGVMVVKGRDGTLWSALTGIGFDGPQKGKKLQRLPSMVTDWGYWLMLHPESTAYNLFDGKKYAMADLPAEITAEAKQNMGEVDSRLPAM